MKDKELLSKENRRKIICVMLLLIISLLSIFVISKPATSPENYRSTIESIDEKKATVMGITATAAATSTALATIPGDVTKVLTKINQKVGFRFITKFGTKGLVNMGKLIPGVGAVVGGSLDLVETKVIGDRAYKWFFEENFISDKNSTEDLIEIEATDLDE